MVDGKLLAAAANSAIALVDPESGKAPCADYRPAKLEILTERGDQFQDVKFSPDGQTIVTASNDYTVRLWDVRPGVMAVPPTPVPQ